jgi:regulatory protein
VIIEGLVPDPRRGASIRVQVGGRPVWTVPADVIAELGLVVGDSIPAEAQQRLDRAADEEGAFRASLRALERRAHGGRELGLKLERKGHTAAAVAAALKRLAVLGLLDDVAFVRQYVQTRAAKGQGPVRLRYDLARLGIARGIVDEALAELARSGADPLASARAVAERRLKSLAGLPREVRRRRLAAFLARRGYRAEAREILEQLIGASTLS